MIAGTEVLKNGVRAMAVRMVWSASTIRLPLVWVVVTMLALPPK